ncbi:MAG: GNAT family N-acetyltransferase [Candidatus Binataceae bacterium]
MSLRIAKVEVGGEEVAAYRGLRLALWPMPEEENLREVEGILRDSRWAVFVAFLDGEPAGMIEVRLREFAEAACSSPVGYLEGWYVVPGSRRKGVGLRLVEAAEAWAKSCGCVEMASDTEIDNVASIKAHERLGYREIGRVVEFLKKLI